LISSCQALKEILKLPAAMNKTRSDHVSAVEQTGQEMGAEASTEVEHSDEEHDRNLGMLLQWPVLQHPPDALFLKLLLLM
jgi:hypothetical protein